MRRSYLTLGMSGLMLAMLSGIIASPTTSAEGAGVKRARERVALRPSAPIEQTTFESRQVRRARERHAAKYQ